MTANFEINHDDKQKKDSHSSRHDDNEVIALVGNI